MKGGGRGGFHRKWFLCSNSVGVRFAFNPSRFDKINMANDVFDLMESTKLLLIQNEKTSTQSCAHVRSSNFRRLCSKVDYRLWHSVE